MSLNNYLKEKELEKVSGGVRPCNLSEWEVKYSTDGSNELITEAFPDEDGNYGYTNGGIMYLGWFNSMEDAYTAGVAFCNENSLHFICVQEYVG